MLTRLSLILLPLALGLLSPSVVEAAGATITENEKAEGRRQKAEGSLQKETGTPPLYEPLNEAQCGLDSLASFQSLEDRQATGQKLFPSALCPLPSAFISQTQSQQAADKRKAKWIVTGTILRMVEQKHYDSALYIANQGVTKYPDFPPFHLARGIALFESGQLEEARPCFERAKQLYRQQKSGVPSEDKSAYESGLHGTYLYLASYDLPNPKRNFSLEPQVTETDLSAMVQLSLLAKKYDMTEQITSYTMQKYPNLAAPYHQRAIARHHLGRKEQARADFEEAMKRYQVQLESANTDKDKTEAQKALKEIENFLASEQSTSEN